MELRQQLIRDIELLPENTLRAVSVFLRDIVMVEFNADAKSETPTKRTREEFFGCMRGQFKMADDFDAPLDDFKEYMP